jgi:glutathione S-transferase
MIGTNATERAKVRALERVVAELFPLCRLYFSNMAPSFLQNLRGIAHNPAVAEAIRPTVEKDLGSLEAHIGKNEFLAGNLPTVADVHFYALLNAGIDKFKYVIPEQFPRLRQWYKNFGQRPSASAGKSEVGFRHPASEKTSG